MHARFRWVVALLFFASNGFAEEPASNAGYQVGKHYEEIVPAQPVATDGKIEVIEVFWYGCSHCYDFEPYINAWAASKAPDVEFRRIPAAFNKTWRVHAKAYYAAEALGVVDKIHAPFSRRFTSPSSGWTMRRHSPSFLPKTASRRKRLPKRSALLRWMPKSNRPSNPLNSMALMACLRSSSTESFARPEKWVSALVKCQR